MTTSMIYQMYQEFIKSKKTLSYRRIATILKELEVIGLLGGRNISKSREGYGREIWLKVPAKSVIDYAKTKWQADSEK